MRTSLAVWYYCDETYRPGEHEKQMKLYYVLSGKLHLQMEEKTRSLSADKFLLIPEFQMETLSLEEDTVAMVLAISWAELETLVGMDHIRLVCDSDHCEEKAGEALRRRILESLVLCTEKSPVMRLREEESVYGILEVLLRFFSIRSEGGRSEDRAAYIKRWIYQNCGRQITLQELAEELDLTISYLSKYFKNQMGCGFNTYVNRIRLQYAMEDMEKNQKSFMKAAMDNGFPNIAAFNRIFQEVYRMAPSEYRIKKEAEEELVCQMTDPVRSAERLKACLSRQPIGHGNRTSRLTIKVNSSERKRYERNWLRILNLGEAESLLRGDVQEHVIKLKRGLGFIYGRINDLLSPQLFVDINAKDFFNFSRVDRVLDFLISQDIIPFCDLGFKERTLRSDVKSLPIAMKKQKEQFSGEDQYQKLVESFITHCIQRYGEASVEKWKLELNWYHWDLTEEEKKQWKRFFPILYHTVKKYSPRTEVGGFGFNVHDENRAILIYLEQCKGQKLRPDFLSVLLYPYVKADDPNRIPWISDKDFMKKEMELIGDRMEEVGFKREQLYVTEWNMSISDTNYLHDSCYKGAYLLQNAIAGIGRCGAMAYWGSTDRTKEYFDSVHLLNGRTGLISRGGIQKPAYYAYDFLNRMGQYLLKQGEQYLITVNEPGDYLIAISNRTPLYESYYQQYREMIPCTQVSSLCEKEELILRFEIRQAPSGTYKLEKLFVNEKNGSVLDEWIRTGDPDHCGKLEEAYLSSICVPHYQTRRLETEFDILFVETRLEANEIQFLHIFLEQTDPFRE